MSAADRRAQLVAGLRQLADLMYERPDLAVGDFVRVSLGIVDSRAALAQWADLLGAKVRMSDDTPFVDGQLAGVALFVQSSRADRVAELERELAEARRQLAERTAAADPLRYSREVDGEVTGAPLPPGVEGIPVSSRPHGSGRPVSAPPAPAEADDECPDPWHTQRDEPTEPCPACNEPHPAAHPIAAAPLRPDADPWHVGRAFAGNRLERTCGCKLAACGLVDTSDVDPDCEHHPAERRKTMRQMHRASQCPALRGPR